MNKKQVYSIAISSAMGTSIGTTIGAVSGDIVTETVYGSMIGIMIGVAIAFVIFNEEKNKIIKRRMLNILSPKGMINSEQHVSLKIQYI
ncbi:MAG: hypothetical protein HKP48_12005 [Winogradskyella sp.]|uniref:hypothetical protein n=1 Tax=Winogradskyella sp. TaxID=1883156 RepID=UPI00183B5AA8|nr:hypothetical protein [Winogradskyella sp.]MBT8243694.1 hypothetical protein [Winogradskyella sp.]NNK23979.1 hypothetical protein [Winogradskyella sp.]